MIRFRMLGALDLRDSKGRELRSVLRRPKPLALLAYLAAARPPGFHRRDTLVALLWPELDHAHARSALRQAVHVLRDAVGRDLLVARGEEEIGLDAGRLWCDARDFEAALDAGHVETALELYRGELLNGFHLSGAPEFERWLEDERQRLGRRAIEGARSLADREETAGNPVGAARWAQRWTELSPADESAVRRLVQLLDRSGDRTGAVRAYKEFEKRLARDLELEPSSETRALVEEIRGRPHGERTAAVGLMEAGLGRGHAAEAAVTQPDGSRPRLKRGARRVRKRVGAVTLLVGGALTGGWLVFGEWFKARSAEIALEPIRLAVLPFVNLGSAENEYFADGVTEEIAARLATIDRLRVIGRTSGNLYKRSEKTIPEIGQELGVGYVLEGSVRWQRLPDGQARVRVTPQLVSTADGARLWAEVYDEPLDEIFEVQSDIAQKVVQALDVTLLEPQRRALSAAPTANLEAYDYYLRGNTYMHRLEEPYAHAAVRMYDQAIGLDPRFALAYARLGRIHSRIHWLYYDYSQDRLALAKRALDKAVELEPDLPQVHLALGAHYWLGYLDYDRALQEFAIAETGLPNESDVFSPRAVLLMRKGSFREAFADYERAWQLDPGSAWFAYNHAVARDFVRDFARAETLYDRSIALGPDRSSSYSSKASLYLRWEGSTEKARAVLDHARTLGFADNPLVLLTRVRVEIFDRKYEEAITLLASAAPEVIAYQHRFIPRAELYAEIYGLTHRRDLEAAYYDSARSVVSRKLRLQPDDPRLHSALGVAYAGLGRKEEAIHQGRRGVELLPVSKEAERGYYREWDLARIYVMVGEHDAAVDRLEHLLSIPGHLTAAWLQIDPAWDPLRDHPRFRRLLARSKPGRAVGTGSGSSR